MTTHAASSPQMNLRQPLLGAAAIVGILAAVKLLVHLITATNYGPFGDELYFMAAGEHLAWGYVDFPPLTAVQGWLARALFGESVFGIHILPALLGAGLVLLTGLIVHELGGKRFAQALAGLAVLVAGIYLYVNSYLSMNSVEPLIWMGCAWVLIRMIKTGNTRLWLAFGGLAGLGLLNKHTMLLFGAALIAGLLLTPARKLLWSKWLLLGGALAFLIFLPNLVWMIRHNFPFFELLANIRADQRNVALSPLEFIAQNAFFLNPLTLPLWLAGLGWFFAGTREGVSCPGLGLPDHVGAAAGHRRAGLLPGAGLSRTLRGRRGGHRRVDRAARVGLAEAGLPGSADCQRSDPGALLVAAAAPADLHPVRQSRAPRATRPRERPDRRAAPALRGSLRLARAGARRGAGLPGPAARRPGKDCYLGQ